MTPAQLLEACLELSGPVEVGESDLFAELLEQARQGGELSAGTAKTATGVSA